MLCAQSEHSLRQKDIPLLTWLRHPQLPTSDISEAFKSAASGRAHICPATGPCETHHPQPDLPCARLDPKPAHLKAHTISGAQMGGTCCSACRWGRPARSSRGSSGAQGAPQPPWTPSCRDVQLTGANAPPLSPLHSSTCESQKAAIARSGLGVCIGNMHADVDDGDDYHALAESLCGGRQADHGSVCPRVLALLGGKLSQA